MNIRCVRASVKKKVWNNLKCLKSCVFQCIQTALKVWKWGFVKWKKNVWNQIKIWSLTSLNYRRVPRRTMWTQRVILPWTHLSARCMHLSLDTHFNPSPIYHLYVLFLESSYQARFCLQISHPAILFTMLKGFLNCGSYIVHILLLGTHKEFTLSVFLPGARSHRSSGHPKIYFCHFGKFEFICCILIFNP